MTMTTTNTTLSKRERLLKSGKRKAGNVTISGELYVLRSPTQRVAATYDLMMLNRKTGKVAIEKMPEATRWMVAQCLLNCSEVPDDLETAERMFEDDEVDILEELGPHVMRQLVEACLALSSGQTIDAEETLGNSD